MPKNTLKGDYLTPLGLKGLKTLTTTDMYYIAGMADDAVALMVGHRTCYSQVASSSPGWAPQRHDFKSRF